jgi:hypothetical protein
MPYHIIKKGNQYAVETLTTKKIHGFTTKTKAEAQLRLLNMLYVKTKN